MIKPMQSAQCKTEWCKSWLVTLKTEKCEVLHITRKNDPTRCQYSLNNILLPEVDHQKHLGLCLESSLSWDCHINSICARANKVLGLIKRTFGYSNKTGIKTAFKALVIPILEYACPVWNPYLVKPSLYFMKIISVQMSSKIHFTVEIRLFVAAL